MTQHKARSTLTLAIPVVLFALSAQAAVPHVRDLIKDAEGRTTHDFLDVDFSVGQAFYVPPGAPADIVATPRGAFDKMIEDPEFRADAEKRGVPVPPRSQQEIAELVGKAKATPWPTIEKIATLVGFK